MTKNTRRSVTPPLGVEIPTEHRLFRIGEIVGLDGEFYIWAISGEAAAKVVQERAEVMGLPKNAVRTCQVIR